MQKFEIALANVASQCEFAYGGMGRVGYLYDSMKDRLRWAKLSAKKHLITISAIGQIMSLSDEDFNKHKVENMRMNDSSISDVFLKAFGDGK